MFPRRTRIVVAIAIPLLILAVLAAYIFLSLQGTNDSCVSMPRLDRPEVGAQTAIVNVSAGTLDLRGAKASIWVNAARVGEINPLTSGASAGPMTFQDVDGHGFLTSGDRFVVETIAGNEYRIDLYFGSCPFPSSQGWTS